MSDLIKRTDAIDAIRAAYCTPCKERGDDYNEVRCRACEFDDAMMQIDSVPSVDAIPCEVADKVGEENERLTYRIGQLEELMRWIPVSERLPSESDYYLATIINGFNEEEVCVIWFAHADDYNMVASEWREITDEDTVIAWQPLPTPYTERSNNE